MTKSTASLLGALFLGASLVVASTGSFAPGEAKITVQADKPGHPLSRYLTGACIEDVNHEIYGGLYSQMIYGESFQEPPLRAPVKGFKAFSGAWSLQEGIVSCRGGLGAKLVSDFPPFADGEAGVEIFLSDSDGWNAGLIVRVAEAEIGADNFKGYEISLNAAGQQLRLVRHLHNRVMILNSPCEVPVGRWVPVVVKMSGRSLDIRLDGKSVARHVDGPEAPLNGTVGLRQYQPAARYKNLWVKTGGVETKLGFTPNPETGSDVSALWRIFRRGTAEGSCALETDSPFVGRQSQRVSLTRGQGEFGVENRGLNRQGMALVAGKPYEGVLWAHVESPCEVWVALESAGGGRVLAETRLDIPEGAWQRLEFGLIPEAAERNGRLAVKLKKPGSVTLGYVFLQPGAWGRFRGLPVRRDVAEAMLDIGLTVLRYGGSMVNHPNYRWKNMIGPRDKRPPYEGIWSLYSSNGWGVIDFVDLCEALGVAGIPAFNMDETPQDMADFVAYMNDPPTTEWGRRRATTGHPEPYRLRHLELGNEESVDVKYSEKFKALAEAIWARDPDIILVAGDFLYTSAISDPSNISGAAGGIASLDGQRQILQLAKTHGREVWFDVHIGTEEARRDESLDGMLSFTDALGKLADGARHRVAVFEFNAGIHSQRRALANALAINAIERDGRIPVACSANGLQVDGQNDNAWDQGLIFMNPSKVWYQPPGYVTQMVSRHYLPVHVPARVEGTGLDVSAKRSEDGRTLVVQVVNVGDMPVTTRIELQGFTPAKPAAAVTELSGPLDVGNSAATPERIVPFRRDWPHGAKNGAALFTFAPHSFTVIRFE